MPYDPTGVPSVVKGLLAGTPQEEAANAYSAGANRLRQGVLHGQDRGYDLNPPQQLPEGALRVINALTGHDGTPRYQLFPERMIRSAFTAPHDAMAGEFGTPGTEEFIDKALPRAMDMSGMMGSGGMISPTGGAGGSLGVFLGPKGIRSLEKQWGGPLPEHPSAVANKATAPIQDQVLREAYAKAILGIREAAGNPKSDDIFKHSGWFSGAEGGIRREIPDLGAKLVPTEVGDLWGTGQFTWDHPMGDLHKAYNVPPIVLNPKATTRGLYDPKTNSIVIRADPFTKGGIREAERIVPHEFQHAIDNSEGFAAGGSPANAPLYKEYYKPGSAFTNMSIKDAVNTEANMKEMFGAHTQNAIDVYKRLMGETSARNVQARREQGFKYLRPPSQTEDIPRSQQLVPYHIPSLPRNFQF